MSGNTLLGYPGGQDVVPLSDASRRPVHFPFVTLAIIAVGMYVFTLELMRGDTFVLQWPGLPCPQYCRGPTIADAVFTAMFLHGGWSHLIGNMVFYQRAIGPEIKEPQ